MKKMALIIGAGDFAEEAFLREFAPSLPGLAAAAEKSVQAIENGSAAAASGTDGRACVIAADAGLIRLEKLGIRPDLIIGDFDSLGHIPAVCEEGKVRAPGDPAAAAESGTPRKADPAGIETVTLQVHKDDTDMEAACELAWERGFRKLCVFGGSGSRPDHFLGNLQLLARYAGCGGDIRLIAPGFTVYALAGGAELLLGKKQPAGHDAADSKDARHDPAGETFDRIFGSCPAAGTTFSVFPHGGTAEGVTIGGDVEYPLEDALLSDDCTLGVSNRTTGPDVRISVRRGTLLVFVYDSPEAAD